MPQKDRPAMPPIALHKTYAAVVSTPVNEQVKKLKKYTMKKWLTWINNSVRK
jgi:hypothetical protein